jgi:hypothetical protein
MVRRIDGDQINALCALMEQTDCHSRFGSLLLKSVSYIQALRAGVVACIQALAGKIGNVYTH